MKLSSQTLKRLAFYSADFNMNSGTVPFRPMRRKQYSSELGLYADDLVS